MDRIYSVCVRSHHQVCVCVYMEWPPVVLPVVQQYLPYLALTTTNCSYRIYFQYYYFNNNNDDPFIIRSDLHFCAGGIIDGSGGILLVVVVVPIIIIIIIPIVLVVIPPQHRIQIIITVRSNSNDWRITPFGDRRADCIHKNRILGVDVIRIIPLREAFVVLPVVVFR